MLKIKQTDYFIYSIYIPNDVTSQLVYPTPQNKNPV
jgi:hypothetical protein